MRRGKFLGVGSLRTRETACTALWHAYTWCVAVVVQVEQMYSLQHIFRVTGDLSILDRHERIQYNSLPGTITPTSWAHQYLQQANEINALYGLKDHVWQTDGADSTGFGVAPNFGITTPHPAS